MGRDKALLEVDGEAMAARVARALTVAGAAPVVAVGGEAGALSRLGLDVVPDRWPGEGPLAATITALLDVPGPAELVFVASCDLLRPDPLAMAATIEALGSHPGAVGAVPSVHGHRQWTHAAWHRRVLPALQAAFGAGGRSLRHAGRDLLVVEVEGVDPDAVADADVPGDLR